MFATTQLAMILCTFTDNLLLSIPAFDRLIFCYENFLFHQKKKMIKTQVLHEKNDKKVYVNIN